MDPSAPQTALKGVAITSSVCGVTAGLYGGFKHGTPGKFLLYSSVNSGIAAATFFSLREYVVGPALVLTLPGKQYQLRRQKLLHAVGNNSMHDDPPLSWTDLRTSRLLDSGISGAFAGSILNTWKRGRQGLVPGLTTGAIMCTLLQWCFNELDILRIRHVSSNSIAAVQHTAQSTVEATQSPHPEISSQLSARPVSSELPQNNTTMDRILSIFGRRVSDEQYLERLKAERDSHLRRIAELEEKKRL